MSQVLGPPLRGPAAIPLKNGVQLFGLRSRYRSDCIAISHDMGPSFLLGNLGHKFEVLILTMCLKAWDLGLLIEILGCVLQGPSLPWAIQSPRDLASYL